VVSLVLSVVLLVVPWLGLPLALVGFVGLGKASVDLLHAFWDGLDALDFQGQLEAYGAISSRRKLHWRYRWPDAVRDDVLARLLALNAERYAEEVAQGLHSKGGSKASGAATADGKRRGRPPKAADSADTEQIGLAL
jgi:hypothetical protein